MQLLLPLIVVFSYLLSTEDGGSLSDEIFRLLDEGDKNIEFHNETNFIVLLGLSGSGKSTLAHYMSGDPDTLIAYDKFGDLIYYDTEGTIGEPGIVSYTLFPLTTIDSDYGDAVVDCPGFEDTRNSSFEIAASYFIKKVFDTSTSVKLIMTISNPGVRPGQDRFMLDNLLSNIIQLVTDIDKYTDSFAMVVTKVPIKINDDSKEVSYIKDFLETVVLDYQHSITETNDQEKINEITNKIKVLSSILNENVNKISVFRVPEIEGPISQSNYSLENRLNIKNVVFNSTHYIPSKIGDFDYALSTVSENFIREELYDEINNKVSDLLNQITSQVIETTMYMGEISYSILAYKDQVDYVYHIIWDVNIEIVTKNTIETLFNNCILYLNSVSYTSFKSSDLSNLLNQFEFFREFTDKIDDPYLEWIKLFTTLREWTRYVENWYVTFVSMYDVAGKPQVQKSKNNIFDSDFLNNTYKVSKENTKEFLVKVKNSQLTEYYDNLDELIEWKYVNLKNYIIRDANIMLSVIQPNITCFDQSLVIRSNFVSITSDILLRECKNISTLDVMAFEKLFLDGNLQKIDTDIIIVSMEWFIDQTVNIDVSGSNGLMHDPPKAQSSDSNYHYDGKMGQPGNPGGFIVVIADKVSNSNLLTFLSNGGLGGKGQDGGDGIHTEDNPNYISNTFNHNNIEQLDQSCIEDFYQCERHGSDKDFTYIYHDIYKKMQQTSGFGGKRGLGGYSGNIDVIFLQNNNDSLMVINNGTSGEVGKGGSGWKLPQIDCSCKLKAIPIIGAGTTIECHVDRRTSKSSYTEADDVSTVDAISLHNRNPTSYQAINNILELKSYYLKNQYLFDVLPLIIKLTNDTNILEYYNIRAFLNEVLMIQVDKYNIKPDILDAYANSLIPVIQNWPTSNEDDKQVMIFLTSTLSSMIWSTQMENGTVFVTDLYEYVKTALKSIEDLNTLSMIEATENLKNNYALSIQSNILEAQKYITKFIDEVFEDIFNDIQNSIDVLVEEIKELKKQVEHNIVELKKKEEQLAAQMLTHTIFGVINVAAQALKIAGPAGTAAGIALGAASSITEDLIIGGVKYDKNNSTTLPAGIMNLHIDLETLKSSRRKGHMETIVFSCDSYLALPNLSELNINNASVIKENALKIDGMSNLPEIDAIILDSINGLTLLFTAVDTTENEEIEKIVYYNLEILDYANDTNQIAPPILNAVTNYGNDDIKIETIADMVKQEKQNLVYLSDFQEAVYEVIMPMVETLHKELSTLKEELENQSSVSLIVKRWEITLHINELTLLMARYTEGFDVQAQIVGYFNQLNEAANLVVTLFEQIQYYQEHVLFAGYIADLHKVGDGVIPDNSQYRNELVSLKKSIVSSNVRVQCTTIVTSFTQQVFPFANRHLGSLNVPNNKFCEGDDQTVINTIKTVETELDKIRNTIINNEDEYINFGVFDSAYESNPPFAFWDNKSYGDDINKLFKGEEISIMAPIIGQKNAVKFRRIQIRFNRTDGGSQDELDNVLKSFSLEQTHFGNSLYQCDSSKYIIRSQPLKFSYDLQYDKDGFPVTSNGVYIKILNGDMSLSPYTMWRLKLKVKYAKEGDFNMLIPFTTSNVNLELFGTGQFVDRNADICKTRLETYYDYYIPFVNN